MRNRIAKLVNNGLYNESLALYSKFQSVSLAPVEVDFPVLLKACAKLKTLPKGETLHAHILKMGFQFQVHTATALTDMYMKLNVVDNAIKVFEEFPEPTIVLLNAVISGYSQNGFFEDALRFFRLVSIENLRHDSVTLAGVLSGCTHVKHGVQLHCWAVKIGVELDIYAATSLLTMYLSCGDTNTAEKLYRLIPFKNVVCYNAYLSGLVQNGYHPLVLAEFNDMRRSSAENTDSVTLISLISACAHLNCLQLAAQVHGFVLKFKLRFETKVGTALVDMYSKCGSWKRGFMVFNELGRNRNIVSYNTMIAGVMLHDQTKIAVDLFAQLQAKGLKPDSATWNSMISGFARLERRTEAILFFRKMLSSGVPPSLKSTTSVLPACCDLPTMHYGEEIHAYVVRTEINTDEYIATAVIDMYMKCGKYSMARKVFDQFNIKPNDPAFWNTMISGYGRNGKNESAYEIFHQMLKAKVRPNSATFGCMLLMCSHTGQVGHWWKEFRSMVLDHGLEPTSGQLLIIVDLLGRFGLRKEAQELLGEITDSPASVCAYLLGASKHYPHSEIGEDMAKRLSDLEPDNPTPLVILSNIYARLGKWTDVERIRDIINQRRLKKVPAFSVVGVT